MLFLLRSWSSLNLIFFRISFSTSYHYINNGNKWGYNLSLFASFLVKFGLQLFHIQRILTHTNAYYEMITPYHHSILSHIIASYGTLSNPIQPPIIPHRASVITLKWISINLCHDSPYLVCGQLHSPVIN